MRAVLFCFILPCIVQYITAQHYQLCEDNTKATRSCTTQILGEGYSNVDSDKVEYIPSNSTDCVNNFGTISSNAHIGGVSLKPYILPVECRDNRSFYSVNYTVLNIAFTNIKWKTMKLRFKKGNNAESNHCRNIVISNLTINDQSVLYYDCYRVITDGNYNGPTHIFDFEATDDYVVNSGRYYFNIPTAQMLSPTISERDWKPFVYIEILTSTMKLHIMPPPGQLKITAYLIELMKECEKGTQCNEFVQNATVTLKNNTQEVTYEYSLLRTAGSYYFIVKPIHETCEKKFECQSVKSPVVTIGSNFIMILIICVTAIVAFILTTLLAYYIVLRFIKRKDKNYLEEIPPPTKVLVIYSTANRLHAECVASFVAYLKSEHDFDITYDGDISNTTHADPYIWAEEAFSLASHVVYVVGPAENVNLYSNKYNQPITAYKNVDTLLLSMLKANRVSCCPKHVINVFFEHSKAPLPLETRHDKALYLLDDWQKLVAWLSKNLLAKKVFCEEHGKNFLEDLSRAKNMLTGKDDVIVKTKKNLLEKIFIFCNFGIVYTETK